MNDRYIAGLDGLRALSLLLVLSAHWAPVQTFNLVAEWGRIGLNVFFVLSGFLITRILVGMRDDVANGSSSFGAALRLFYVRRAFRIFPVYLIGLFALAVSGNADLMNEDILWHLTFMANNSAAFLRDPGAYGPAAHLWSLCVEEQFYLLWAPCVLALKARIVVRIVCVAIVGSILYRLIGFAWGDLSSWTIFISTPGNLDSMAAGAGTALIVSHGADRRWSFVRPLIKISLIVGSAGFAYFAALRLALGWREFRTLATWVTLGDCTVYMVVAPVIYFLARSNAHAALVAVLELPAVRMLGRVSYGFYVYHQIVRAYIKRLATEMNHADILGVAGTMEFLVFFPPTLAVALISFYRLERPLLTFRDRFYIGSPQELARGRPQASSPAAVRNNTRPAA